MPPKLPQYGSPLLAILRGGKEAVKPEQPVFGVPQATPPSIQLPQTAQTTRQLVQPAPVAAPMPVQSVATPPPINPLDIIRRGKEQTISQRTPGRIENLRNTLPRGLSEPLFGTGMELAAGQEIIPGVRTETNRSDTGLFGFMYENLSKSDQRKFTEMTQTLGGAGINPERIEGIASGQITDLTPEEKKVVYSKKGLDILFSGLELLDAIPVVGQLTKAPRVGLKSSILNKIVGNDNASEIAEQLRKTNPVFNTPQTQQLAEVLAQTSDERVIQDSIDAFIQKQQAIKAVTPKPTFSETISKSLGLDVLNTPAMRQGGYVGGTPSGFPKPNQKRIDIEADIVLERIKSYRGKVTNLEPDDMKRFEDLSKTMERRALGPDELAEAKAIIERVEGRLPSAEMGAMDIKKPTPAKTTDPKNFKTADEYVKAQPKQPTVPTRDYPGLRKQGGFADFFAPVKARETAPTVKPKTEQRIKIDADIKDIRKSLQNRDLNAEKIGELETRLSIMEESIPDVSLIRRIAGKQLANGDTLSQVQATAQKIVSQSDFLKSISLTDANRILETPKSFTAREVEGARVVRRAHLDDIVTEFNYGSLDEAGQAVTQFDEIKASIKEAKDQMREVKGERALSNKVKQVVTTATAKRRDEVKFLKDQYMLTDSDVRKATGGRDFRTMSEGRFNDTVRNMEQIGIENADRMQAKAELMDLMERRQFEKVENYRRAQELPPLSEMNAAQFRQYAEALEQFQTNDTFLTQRQLEVVDRSSLKGVRTIREARERLLEHIQKMPGLENTKLEDLNVTPTALDYVRYDTALAEKNPFYKYLVTRTQEHMLVGEAEFLTVQNKVLDLAKKANQSRNKGIKQLFVPKHEEIIQYLEAPVDQKATFAKALTKEELDYANFVSDYYSKAYDHLVMQKELYGSRYVDQYFTHIRRTFLETWTDDGFIKAVKESWQAQKDNLMVANIIDQDTGQILPKSKFFQYTMQRTGEITPSKNLTRVFLQYSKTFERKKMFDRMIPEMDIYVQSLTPTGLTKGGLETDRTLKKFFNQYINNKKGRTVPVTQLITQNNPVDIGLRMGNTLVSIRDLGFSVIAQTAALVGEAVATYQSLGKIGLLKSAKRRVWDTGFKRLTDPNAAKILKDNEEFIGRNLWTELAEVDTPLTDKFMQGMFGGFSQATVESNKIFLLANLTKAELKAGKLSAQRLAELRLDAGRWRDMGKDVKSIVGSTSVGQMSTKYKGWAIPIARTNIKNLSTLAKNLAKGDMKKALTSRELLETYRMIEISAVVFLIGQYVMAQNEEDTFVGKLKARAYMEANTLLSGIDPANFASTPRLITFTQQLLKNLKSIVLLEEYASDTQWGKEGDLKGVKGLQRQFTPATVRSLQKPATATGDPLLDSAIKEQKKESDRVSDESESLHKELKKLSPEEANARVKELKETDPAVHAALVRIVKDEKKKADWTNEDKAITKLGIANGKRAEFIHTKAKSMAPEEANAYIKTLREKGIVTKDVMDQLKKLIKEERDIIEQ